VFISIRVVIVKDGINTCYLYTSSYSERQNKYVFISIRVVIVKDGINTCLSIYE